ADFVTAAAERLGLAIEATIAADWRTPPPLPRYDLILASDVLYEARNLVPVARFISAHLTADGEAWVGDPGRNFAGGFLDVARSAGLDGPEEGVEGRHFFRLRLRR
ncbi:MAG: hypothetical protein KDB53_10015, partial [Planctomycetes bacterium]|nr:hypothetical protein [Planctomycetota bacterium]